LVKEGKKEEAKKHLNGKMAEIVKVYEGSIYKLVEMKTRDASETSSGNKELAGYSSK